MPIYIYKCSGSHTAEISRSIADRDTPTLCPTCQAEMKRQMDFGSIEFKGSGFYRVDSRANGR